MSPFSLGCSLVCVQEGASLPLIRSAEPLSCQAAVFQGCWLNPPEPQSQAPLPRGIYTSRITVTYLFRLFKTVLMKRAGSETDIVLVKRQRKRAMKRTEERKKGGKER